MVAARHEYRAEGSARATGRIPSQAERVVGLADLDLGAPHLKRRHPSGEPRWAARGGAGPSAPGVLGLPADPPLFLARAAKAVVHEFGHAHRLARGEEPACMLRFSNTLAEGWGSPKNCNAAAIETQRSIPDAFRCEG